MLLSQPSPATALHLLCLLSLAHLSKSFSTIHLPPKITAASNIPITLTQTPTDARFTHYEILLRGCLPIDARKGLREFPSQKEPLCMLLNRTAIPTNLDSEVITLQIPSSAVPAPGRYSLDIQEYRLDKDGGMPDFERNASAKFELVAGKEGDGAEWAEFESDPRLPYGIGDPYNVPCRAYDCVRKCFQQRYPEFLEHLEDEDGGLSAMRPILLCKAACPGVHTPREVWRLIGGKDETGDGDAGSDGANPEASDVEYGEFSEEL